MALPVRLWKNNYLETSTLFTAILPKPTFDSEFHLHEAVSLANQQATSSKEANRILGNLLEATCDLDLSSLFQQKRATHLDLSAEDLSSVEVYLDACKQDIISTHEKITGLITTIVGLCNELSKATALLHHKAGQRDLCQYLLTPMRFIHQDLLEPIFMAYFELDDTRTGPKLKPKLAPKAPLRLSSVCYRWREIARATPALWSHIYVDTDVPNSLNLAELWLSRCRFPSLTLHVRQRFSLGTLANLLASSKCPQTQIRHLELQFPNHFDAHILSTILDGHVDELEELVLKNPDAPINVLPVSHDVKRLYLDRVPTSWTSNRPPSQVVVLRITEDIHRKMLYLILSQCTILQKLYVSLTADGVSGASMAPENFNCHEHLTYLGLGYVHEEQEFPENLLSKFSFPSLKIFEYYMEGYLASRALACTNWLLSLSFINHLQRLSLLLVFRVPPEFYNTLFHTAHSLEELSIFLDLDAEPMPQVFEALTTVFSASASPRQLPNLRSVHLSSIDDLTPVSDEILRMGQAWASASVAGGISRGPPHSCSLRVYFWNQMGLGDGKDKKLLDAFRDTYPNLEVRLIRHKSPAWIRNFPRVFEMNPPAFNEVRRFESMDQEGNWISQTGPIYRIA